MNILEKKRYRTLVNVACPTGMWNQVHDVVCDDEDIEHIRQLRKEYKNLNRNLWNPFDPKFEKIMGWIAKGILECIKSSKSLPDEPIEDYQYIPLSSRQLALVELLKVLLKFNASCHNVATKLINLDAKLSIQSPW